MKTLIDVSKVYQVYSGKNGRCCCGCSGKYTVATAHRVYASKRCGYQVDAEDCNDRTVKMFVNKMNSHPDTKWLNDDQATLVVGDRLYMAILVKEEKK
jgi:hypothetical protein